MKALFSNSIYWSLLIAPLVGHPDNTAAPVESLGEYIVEGRRIANTEPGTSYPQLVSSLRFDPQIDLQTRNFGEAQGDISLRGGIFEGTGFKFGAISIFDPQTGHYAAELPISPEMATPHRLSFGLKNSLYGFNSTVGTLRYGFSRISEGFHGVLSGGAGENGYHREGIRVSAAGNPNANENASGIEIDVARSESEGALAGGDHVFERVAGRIQLSGTDHQTDLFAGYQAKFFGWPNMYTPFGRSETENLQTRLFLASHRVNYASDNFIEISGYFRGHRDHYTFDRFQPQIFQAFHETRVFAGGVEGKHEFQALKLTYSGQYLRDEIDSSALNFGKFQSREYLKFGLSPELQFDLGGDRLLNLYAGAAVDWTNRDGTAVSPGAGVVVLQKYSADGSDELYLEFATGNKVPGYTAIASNPAGGLFRGNPDLGREESRNLEGGLRIRRQFWSAHITAWHRWDRDMLDWTFSFSSTSARTANPVDIDTTGIEIGFHRDWQQLAIVLGYTYLSKSLKSAPDDADASFYALNFPRHRLTAAAVWQPLPAWTVRIDNELREQEENLLRNGSSDALISYLTVSWQPEAKRDFVISLSIDNLFDSRFEEIPAVPATPRQVSMRVSYGW